MKFARRFTEGYNIPYSGWVILNDDRNFVKRGFFRKEHNTLWTDSMQDAEIFKDEDSAYRCRAWIDNYYNDVNGKSTGNFYVHHVESDNDEFENAALKYLPDLLGAYSNFILAATKFGKTVDEKRFDSAVYTEDDYDKKKSVPQFLLSTLANNSGVVQWLGAFYKELQTNDKVNSSNTEYAENFIKMWNLYSNLIGKIPKNYIQAIVQHLQKMQ